MAIFIWSNSNIYVRVCQGQEIDGAGEVTGGEHNRQWDNRYHWVS
jgi:hypothetical protein